MPTTTIAAVMCFRRAEISFGGSSSENRNLVGRKHMALKVAKCLCLSCQSHFNSLAHVQIRHASFALQNCKKISNTHKKHMNAYNKVCTKVLHV